MSDRIVVGVAFPIDEAGAARLRSIDPRIELRLLGDAFSAAAVGEQARAALHAALAEVEVLAGPSFTVVDHLAAATTLRWLQVVNAGVERLVEAGMLGRGFVVTNVSGLAAAGIAEWVLGAMVVLTKGMHQAVRDQAEHRWLRGRFTGLLDGKTVGIVGMGAIGRAVAKRARAFDMRVVACRRTVAAGTSDPDCDAMHPFDALEAVLGESDYVVLCVPLTKETVHLIDEARLAQMKPTAFLVNIARGQCVDQRALVAALQAGTIAGAALDVTDPEPLPPDDPLWDLPNVLITPHNSGAIEGYFGRALDYFAANLERWVQGEPLANVVDEQLGY